MKKKTKKVSAGVMRLAEILFTPTDDGDYKDRAADWYDAIYDAAARMGRLEEIKDMPDAHNCPRSFLGWLGCQRSPRKRLKDAIRILAEKGKWRDEYVRRLGMIDHCDEIGVLHRREAEIKAEGNRVAAQNIGEQLMKEAADLWIILEICRVSDSRFANLCSERAKKFKP